MRLRISFAKTDAMRYTSHLDLHKTWERTIRRTGLPLVYSQGFNPRPKLQLASALPLGFTSDSEVLDAWFAETDLSITQILEAMQKAAPPGLQIHNVTEIDSTKPPLQTQVRSAEYVITLLESVPNLEVCLESRLSDSSLPRQRRGKPYDLRPLIETLSLLLPDEQGRSRIAMRLSAREAATGRPEEVLAALGISPESTRIHRSHLIFDE
ncbi:MAG TPA: TIGR03936 family radical SAM-associated protein [Anaerolineales bacterium]|nr:TIGR03936 family radical SAM-associated protein [Anaerolineales bacterium]